MSVPHVRHMGVASRLVAAEQCPRARVRISRRFIEIYDFTRRTPRCWPSLGPSIRVPCTSAPVLSVCGLVRSSRRLESVMAMRRSKRAPTVVTAAHTWGSILKSSVAFAVVQSTIAFPPLHARENTPGFSSVQSPVGVPVSNRWMRNSGSDQSPTLMMSVCAPR